MRKLVFLAAVCGVGFAWASNGRETIPDVRVSPLLQSYWGQKSDTGYSNTGNPCFNYYTPNNAPCGCSATAMAQIMRYWQYPANAPAGSYVCVVDGEETTFEVESGAYDWVNMPLDTREGIDENQRQAIGKLTYDCAVALHTLFYAGGSAAFSDYAFSIFTGTFGYANAIGYCPADIAFADIKRTMFANLDLGCPVMLDLVTANDVGHQVLADGYGFDGTTPYVHIVFGWPQKSELCNRWYALPSVEADAYAFTKIDSIVYNIFPSFTGDILSGRVTDASGQPVSNVLVKATYKTGSSSSSKAVSQLDWTGENGIYAFVLDGGKSYVIECEGQAKTVKLSKSISAACFWDNPLRPYHTEAGTLGNSWGNDFVIAGGLEPTPTPEPDPDDDDSLGAFNPPKAINGAYPYCGAVYDATGAACGTVSLKIGKVSRGTSKISGTVALTDGKKYSIKSTSFPVNAEDSVEVAGIEVKKLGLMSLKIGANGFEAVIDKSDGVVLSAKTADLTKGLDVGSATFVIEGLPETLGGHPILSDCLPEGQVISVSAKKWDCGKAASVKYAKVKDVDAVTGRKLKTYHYELQGLNDPKKPNASGLKLTYTAKSASFKGSFYLYTDVGTEAKPKLKKTTVAVNGFVIGGRAFGQATAKVGKDVYAWPVSIE